MQMRISDEGNIESLVTIESDRRIRQYAKQRPLKWVKINKILKIFLEYNMRNNFYKSFQCLTCKYSFLRLNINIQNKYSFSNFLVKFLWLSFIVYVVREKISWIFKFEEEWM